MANSDYLPCDLKTLWKELNVNPLRISPDQLRQEAKKLNTGLKRRSVVGGIAAAIVIVSFGLFFFVFPDWLQRIGSILTVVGALYIFVQLRMRPAREMPDVALSSCLRFYRSELQRQRDFHRGKWFWSRLLIFLPGPIVWFAGFAQTRPRLALFIWGELIAFLILCAIAVSLNLRLARTYQRRIDALDLSLRDLE